MYVQYAILSYLYRRKLYKVGMWPTLTRSEANPSDWTLMLQEPYIDITTPPIQSVMFQAHDATEMKEKDKN